MFFSTSLGSIMLFLFSSSDDLLKLSAILLVRDALMLLDGVERSASLKPKPMHMRRKRSSLLLAIVLLTPLDVTIIFCSFVASIGL